MNQLDTNSPGTKNDSPTNDKNFVWSTTTVPERHPSFSLRLPPPPPSSLEGSLPSLPSLDSPPNQNTIRTKPTSSTTREQLDISTAIIATATGHSHTDSLPFPKRQVKPTTTTTIKTFSIPISNSTIKNGLPLEAILERIAFTDPELKQCLTQVAETSSPVAQRRLKKSSSEDPSVIMNLLRKKDIDRRRPFDSLPISDPLLPKRAAPIRYSPSHHSNNSNIVPTTTTTTATGTSTTTTTTITSSSPPSTTTTPSHPLSLSPRFSTFDRRRTTMANNGIHPTNAGASPSVDGSASHSPRRNNTTSPLLINTIHKRMPLLFKSYSWSGQTNDNDNNNMDADTSTPPTTTTTSSPSSSILPDSNKYNSNDYDNNNNCNMKQPNSQDSDECDPEERPFALLLKCKAMLRPIPEEDC